jgi:hypothetical protein
VPLFFGSSSSALSFPLLRSEALQLTRLVCEHTLSPR